MTFRTVLQIAGCHTLIASRILSTFMGFISIHVMVVLKLLGVSFPDSLFGLAFFVIPLVRPWRWLTFLFSLFIYAVPANLWAIYEMTRFEFAHFRLHPVSVPYKLPAPKTKAVNRSRPYWMTFFLRMQLGFVQLRQWIAQR